MGRMEKRMSAVVLSVLLLALGGMLLQDLLAGWDGTSPRALAQELLHQSWQRTGGADDCAGSVLAMDGREDARPV